MENYIDTLKTDKELTDTYYKFSLHTKSEQQKQLEDLFRVRNLQPQRIADIACGGGVRVSTCQRYILMQATRWLI